MNFAYVAPSGNLVISLSRSELEELLNGKYIAGTPRKRPFHHYANGAIQEDADTYPVIVRNSITNGRTEHYVQFISIYAEGEKPDNE